MTTQEKPEEKSNVIPLKAGIQIAQEKDSEPGVKEILEDAAKRDLTDCIVIGRTKDEMLYFSTTVNEFEFVWFCERAKQAVMTSGDE
jgi:hypothetical protein